MASDPRYIVAFAVTAAFFALAAPNRVAAVMRVVCLALTFALLARMGF